MGRGIGSECQPARLGGFAEAVQHDAGLDARGRALRVHLQDPIHRLREIEYHPLVTRLPGQTGTATACHDGRTMAPDDLHRERHIRRVARQHDAEWNLPVIGCIGAVQCTAAGVEPHVARESCAKLRLEPL